MIHLRGIADLSATVQAGFVGLLQGCLLVAALHTLSHLRAEKARAGSDALSLTRAAVLEPANAAAHAAVARSQLQRGNQDEAERSLVEAHRRSPADTRILTELALLHEQQHDLHHAEQELLQAARLSSLFEPRWTLANFYFRNGSRDKFDRWIRSAQLLAPDGLTGAFRLCVAQTRDVFEATAHCIAPNPRVLSDFVEYLMSAGQLESALSVAKQFQDLSPPVLLKLTDRSVQASLFDSSFTIWQNLSTRGFVAPKQNLSSLANADFESRPSSQGFDWHLSSHPAVTFAFEKSEAAISFAGTQPEQVDVLWQTVPFAVGRKYELDFEFRTEGIVDGSGPTWRIQSRGYQIESVPLASEQWRAEKFIFEPAGPSTLSLRAARRIGFTRIEGLIRIRKLRIREVS